ncbi:MAG TPA: phytanoyl-CoA dioxygenase family protein [Alphaproteobacteria bacterium]
MTTRRLSEQEIAHYRDQGYVVVADLLSEAVLAAIDRDIARVIDGARAVAKSNDIYDLEDTHRADRPRVRRIKQPHKHCPAVDAALRSAEIVTLVGQLVGPDIRLQGTKLNMKSAEYGAPVDWHQDWAFYPHTNTDVLAVGVMLDDMTEDNGPLMVLPGSHKGPVYDHHDGGFFRGAFDVAGAGLDISKAVKLKGRRGSISIHHALMVHGSSLNRSGADRRLLLFELMAADAWPLAGTATKWIDLDEFRSRMVAGELCLEPRMEAAPVRIPQPQPPGVGSIYDYQATRTKRHFETYREDAPAPLPAK